jgi:hypothetical protein
MSDNVVTALRRQSKYEKQFAAAKDQDSNVC